MSGFLFQITSIIFFGFLILSAISWLTLWDEKEYNFKRLLIHLKETKQGRSLIFGPTILFKWVLILSYSVTIFFNEFDGYYHIAVSFFYTILFFVILNKIRERDIIKPRLSIYSLFIFFTSISISLFLFVFPPLDRFLWMLAIDVLLPLIIAILIIISFIFFDFEKDIIINKALRKMQNNKSLLTIAVIGSYGKGTTKEFISRVLKTKYNVLETKSSFDTTLGIARTIIKELTHKKQIFIAEMEDSRFGEIGEMCNIIIPKITVVTGINDQNFSMFGNIDRILESKFQAIESLPEDGIALFNGNNRESTSLFYRTRYKKFSYGIAGIKILNSDIQALKLKINKLSTSFYIRAFNKEYNIGKIKLIGRQSVESLLPAIFIGLYMGIDFSLIRKAIQEINPLPGTMDPKITRNKTILIDDTYNANFTSVMQAIYYMKIYNGKKMLVLEPLIELGKNAKADHLKLGREIGKFCDFLFLTNDNFKEEILKGIREKKGRCEAFVQPPAKISNFIKKRCGEKDVVVFEGREALKSLSLLSFESAY